MARLFKRAGDDFWWLDFTSDGRRRRVKTTTKSRRAAEDLLAEKRAEATRVKLGLEVAVTSKFPTVASAWEYWLEHWCPAASKRVERSRFKTHVAANWFGQERLTELTGERVDKWLNERAAFNSARTVNGHRRIARRVFNCLIRRRYFRGVNPVNETEPREEAEFDYQLLTEDEFARVVTHMPASWQPLATLAFTTGLRRGEIFALRKDRNVVDLDARTLTPRASNSRAMPKGKKVKSIPLFEESLAVLQKAWDNAEPGGILFPSARGGLRSENARAAEMVRRAMVSARMIDGWDHKCRRRDCGGELRAQRDEQQRRCPKCDWILWPHPIVRRVRFHDLRHSCAAYLLDRGVELYVVSQLLRHSSIVITQKIYAHRTVRTLREALDKQNPFALERELERLATIHPVVAAELRDAAKKAAQTRHQTSNVSLLSSRKGA